jgi:2,3-bisphosphoglycerate-independent phosphoglycerate mutase
VLLDGLGDRAYPALDGKTPLAAANTPALDRLAERGCCGLFHATFAGEALPSETAHFMLFGCDPGEFPGRGVLEALGAGISLSPGQVAILAHFSVLREENGVLYMVENKPKVDAGRLAVFFKLAGDAEIDGIFFRFHQTEGFRGVLVLDGEVSRHITDTDPIADGMALIEPEAWADAPDPPAARRTAWALKRYLVDVRRKLAPFDPIGGAAAERSFFGVVTQRAGMLTAASPFTVRNGLRGLSLASGLVYEGLAKFIGMDFVKAVDTDDPGADLAERIRRAKEALARGYEFVHVHTKAPDQAAHTKDPRAKLAVIESLDRGIASAIGPLLEDPQVLVVVTADHSTPSAGPLVHSGEPVPVVFCGPGVRKDNVACFDEVCCASGALGFLRGRELMGMILNYLDRARLSGLRDDPTDRPYWPGKYRPFFMDPKNGKEKEND